MHLLIIRSINLFDFDIDIDIITFITFITLMTLKTLKTLRFFNYIPFFFTFISFSIFFSFYTISHTLKIPPLKRWSQTIYLFKWRTFIYLNVKPLFI